MTQNFEHYGQRMIAQLRANVEHPLRVIKRPLGDITVRYSLV